MDGVVRMSSVAHHLLVGAVSAVPGPWPAALFRRVVEDGRTKVKSPSATLSTAEAISVMTSGIALAAHFGDGVLRAADIAAGLQGAIVKDPVQDGIVWAEYLETVVRDRKPWGDLYRACRELA